MSFLTSFLQENELPPSGISSSAEQTIDKKNNDKIALGKILIAGCTDWDANRNQRGLPEVHRIDFNGHLVRGSYSSAYAHHSFFVVDEAKGKFSESLYGLGKSDLGQMGTGMKATYHEPHRLTIPLNKPIKKIATGRFHSVILFESGELYGCGSNDCGQLGVGEAFQEWSWKLIKTVLPVVDVSCGFQFTVFCDTAGHVYSFGHPEFGQLGHGVFGEFIDKRKSVFEYVKKPKRIEEYVTKDARNKVTGRLLASEVFIVSVAAGKNHGLCIESSDSEPINGITPQGRVFSWGFGGYGRLGHNGTQDELVPRSIDTFSTLCGAGQAPKPLITDNCVTKIFAGNNVSAAITRSKRLFLFGIVNNTASKESNMYPKEVPDLFGAEVDSVSFGLSCIYVLSGPECHAWGTSVAGVMGFADSKTSSSCKELDLRGLQPLDVACGYLHTCIRVRDMPAVARDNTTTKPKSTPVGKRGFASVMAEPTVCPFVKESHVTSYFPELTALPPMEPEVKKPKKPKTKDGGIDYLEPDNEGASENEGESYDEESSSEESVQSDDSRGKKRTKKRAQGFRAGKDKPRKK